MALPEGLVRTIGEAGIAVELDVPLRKKTWWRAGGPADGFASVHTVEQLAGVQRATSQTRTPLFVLGNASNLLVSDRGIRGLVIRLLGDLRAIRPEGDPPVLALGAGVKMIALVKRMQREGWTGLEFLAGVPGTIGGGIVMNAGTALGEVVDALVDVTLVDRDGTVRTVPAAELNMAYRHCELPEGAIVASARFRTTGADRAESAAKIAHHLDYRARTQPVDVPTCGSTFRNPPGDTAGRLIDATGLKGTAVGGARVSPKHANFVENTGNATADDIRALIEQVQDAVEAAHGVRLRREVHFAGDWSHWTA